MSKRKYQPDQVAERRTFAIESIRAVDGEKPHLVGHAAVFNRETVLVKADSWFKGSPEIREIIEPGAFSKTITETDQCSFWNHNSDIILGRRSNGTLKLAEDQTGLATEIFPPDTQLVRDMVMQPIDKGYVTKMSFGFRTIRDQVVEENNVITIRLKEVELIEVSPCALPAYQQTDLSLSARSEDRIEDFRQQRQAANQSAPGLAAHPEQAKQPEATPATEHPEQSAPLLRHLDEALRMRLEIEEAELPIAA